MFVFYFNASLNFECWCYFFIRVDDNGIAADEEVVESETE